MIAKYYLFCDGYGCRIHDSDSGEYVTDWLCWDEASRLVRKLNALQPPPEQEMPAPPCCDCRQRIEKLDAALVALLKSAETLPPTGLLAALRALLKAAKILSIGKGSSNA